MDQGFQLILLLFKRKKKEDISKGLEVQVARYNRRNVVREMPNLSPDAYTKGTRVGRLPPYALKAFKNLLGPRGIYINVTLLFKKMNSPSLSSVYR